MKWHWIVLRITKLFNKKVIIISEPLRHVTNDDSKSNSLMNKENLLKN